MTSNERCTGLVKDLIESIIQSRDVLVSLVQQAVKDGIPFTDIHNEIIKQTENGEVREEFRKFGNDILRLRRGWSKEMTTDWQDGYFKAVNERRDFELDMANFWLEEEEWNRQQCTRVVTLYQSV